MSHIEEVRNKQEQELQENTEKSASLIDSLYRNMLKSRDTEEVNKALETVKAIKEYRDSVGSGDFIGFTTLIENFTLLVTATQRRAINQEKKEEVIERSISYAQHYSPRVAQVYLFLVKSFLKLPNAFYGIEDPKVISFLEEQQSAGNIHALFNPDASWSTKSHLFNTELKTKLAVFRYFDKEDRKEKDREKRKQRKKEIQEKDNTANPEQDRSKPGVDHMSRAKEGEKATPVWSISPPVYGLFRAQAYTQWDKENCDWFNQERQWSEPEFVELDSQATHVSMTCNAPTNEWIPLPLAYKLEVASIEADHGDLITRQNEFGDIFFKVDSQEKNTINIKAICVVRASNKTYEHKGGTPSIPDLRGVPVGQREFSEETEEKLKEVDATGKRNMHKAKILMHYVFNRLKYLEPSSASEAESYNQRYRQHPSGFAAAVDEIQEADCDVANTYFAALCARLNIPVRHVVGDSVSGSQGNASMTHWGTGHAWTEVYNDITQRWELIDATPAGDPNLDEDNKNDEAGDDPVAVDDKIMPPQIMTDEELKKLVEKLEQRAEEVKYTAEDERISKLLGIDIKEAQAYNREIEEAKQARLESGMLLTEALKEIFGAITELRTNADPPPPMNVERSEGGKNLIDVVRALLEEFYGRKEDSRSYEATVEVESLKFDVSGFDVYFIGDLSGSMGAVDGSTGQTRAELQRHAVYLILHALHEFQENLKAVVLAEGADLDIRTHVTTFGRAEGVVDIKTLDQELTDEVSVGIWQHMKDGRMGNQDVEALSHVSQKIRKDHEKMLQSNPEQKRLRLVFACSDGGYLHDGDSMKQISARLHDEVPGAIVFALGLTKDARTVPAHMEDTSEPKKHRGQLIENIQDLPIVVGKYVVSEALKLLPSYESEDVETKIDEIIKEFNI